MVEQKFIEVTSVAGNRTIAIDQIAMVEPSLSGTTLHLKIITNGENQKLSCSDKYRTLSDRIFAITHQI